MEHRLQQQAAHKLPRRALRRMPRAGTLTPARTPPAAIRRQRSAVH
jgi:hypothetical protein